MFFLMMFPIPVRLLSMGTNETILHRLENSMYLPLLSRTVLSMNYIAYHPFHQGGGQIPMTIGSLKIVKYKSNTFVDFFSCLARAHNSLLLQHNVASTNTPFKETSWISTILSVAILRWCATISQSFSPDSKCYVWRARTEHNN